MQKVRLWRLYAKFADSNRFAPVDWKSGNTVGNLIHASMFTHEEKEKVQAQLELPEIARQNSGTVFEWRRIN